MDREKGRGAKKSSDENPQSAEREWRKTFDADLDAIWILDEGMRISKCNETACRMFGLSREEMVGRSCWSIVHGKEGPIRDCPMMRVQKSRARESMELRIGERWFAVHVDPILDEEGRRITGYVHITSEITARKRAEEALEGSESRFRLMVEQAPVAMAVVGLDGRIEFINRKAVSVFGYPHEEIPTMERWWALAYPDGAYRAEVVADWTGRVRRAMERGAEIEGNEYRVACRNGEAKTVFIYGSFVADKVFVMFEDITPRRKAEEALRESENKFRSVFENSNQGLAIVGLDGRYLAVNQTLCGIYGYGEEELTRADFFDITHPDDKERSRAILVEVLNGKEKCVRFAKRYIHKDGRVIWAEVSSSTVLDANGKPLYFITHVSDISERKRMEEALLESERRYKMVTELATDYAFKLGVAADGSVAMDFVSDNYYSITGRSKEEAVSVESWSGIVYPDDQGKLMALLKRLISEPQTAELECRSFVHGGKLRWIQVFCRSERDEGEERVVAIVGAVKDITDRKRAEEAMAAEKERLAVTLASIGDAVIATDVRGDVVLMNKVAEDLTGWPQREAMNRPLSRVFDIVGEDGRERLENPVEKVLASGSTIELADHALLIARDGTERVIDDSGAPIKDGEGRILGVVLVFRDVTERLRYQDAIQRTARLESLGVLAGGIAHDFNNLLTGIYGYMDLALSASQDERIRAYIEVVFATMKRAKALTLQLLTFSKGGSPVQKSTPLSPFVEETAKFALSGSNISCRFSLDGDLKPCSIDKDQIAQVIDNIVINAQQAMPNGGTIEISAVNASFAENEHPPLAEGDYVEVSIRDSGIGIPKAILPRIFDPFYTTKTKGHGLGLATCHSIVSRHGGCIEAESEPGEGSVFRFYLPAATQPAAAEAADPGVLAGRGRVLVMDDERVVREIFKNMLESMGYEVICVNDGREAVRRFREESEAGRRMAAMIFDLTVPGAAGGVEAVAGIRELDEKVPVFVSSGYAENSVMKSPQDYGFSGSIAKPFSRAELSRALSSVLGSEP